MYGWGGINDSTSYEKLLAALRKYTNDQDLNDIKDIKPRANFLMCMIAFIWALYPFKIRSKIISV